MKHLICILLAGVLLAGCTENPVAPDQAAIGPGSACHPVRFQMTGNPGNGYIWDGWWYWAPSEVAGDLVGDVQGKQELREFPKDHASGEKVYHFHDAVYMFDVTSDFFDGVEHFEVVFNEKDKYLEGDLVMMQGSARLLPDDNVVKANLSYKGQATGFVADPLGYHVEVDFHGVICLAR